MAETDTSKASEGVKLDERSRFQDMVRSLKHRNFQLFFSGQMISLIGTWMDNIAEAWLVYRLTGSSLLLGTVAFAGQIPVFLLAPVGGMVADRWNRRSIVIATQVSSMILAFILAFLTLTKRITVAEVIVLAALMGVVNAFDIPARQSFLVEMVGREDLMNAIALNSSMFNGARMIGPSIAGILVASIGEGWCFFANAVSYIAVIAGLLMMRIERKPRDGQLRRLLNTSPKDFASCATRRRFERILTSAWAREHRGDAVHRADADFCRESASRQRADARCPDGSDRNRRAERRADAGLAHEVQGLGRWIAISCAAFGLALILFSFSRWYVLSVLLLVPVGFAMMTQMASSNTLIQSMVPDRLRGRTMAVYSMMFMGMAPIGALLSGALADHIGAPWTVAIGGLGAIIGGAIFWRDWPKIRVEARELLVAQGSRGFRRSGRSRPYASPDVLCHALSLRSSDILRAHFYFFDHLHREASMPCHLPRPLVNGLIPGCATPQATLRYAARFQGRSAAGHFRELPGGLVLSSIGIGTYLGEADRSHRWRLHGCRRRRRGRRLQRG